MPLVQGNEAQISQEGVGEPLVPPAGSLLPRERRPYPASHEPIEVAEGGHIRTPDRFEIPVPPAQVPVQPPKHLLEPLVLCQPCCLETPSLRLALVLQARSVLTDGFAEAAGLLPRPTLSPLVSAGGRG